MARTAKIARKNKETNIELDLALDGEGRCDISTGIGFFDHMLNHVGRHGLFDLRVRAQGDLHIDGHHTVEDVGICLGKALLEAVGEPTGLVRFGHAVVPMDEALAEVALDFSGRPMLVFNAEVSKERVGELDVELVEEFMQAFAANARVTLHVGLRYGTNAHHGIEAIFKAFGRALRTAVELDARVKGVPSTKGMLEA